MQALLLTKALLNETDAGASSVLIRWAASGDVASRCRLARSWGDESEDITDVRNSNVEPEFWHRFGAMERAHGSNWKAGDFTIRFWQREWANVTITGVEFDALGIRDSAPPLPEQLPSIAPPQSAPMTGFDGPRLQDRGRTSPEGALDVVEPPESRMPTRRVGRPSKDYWEEALVEIMRQIWMAELKPRRAADVRHAMAEWIVEQGYEEPKPTQLKERARLIFQVYEKSQE